MPDVTGGKVTVMCYFASDNPLSPLLVSQVKAIKDAGYEQGTDVLVRFDPNETSARTRLYHVNARRRELGKKNEEGRQTLIGDGENHFVRNMAEDIVDPDTIDTEKNPDSKGLKKELTEDGEVSAQVSLKNFIDYSLENHPADHYILFLIGHGMIVGNDAFLPDDSPNSGISLEQLEDLLKPFKTKGSASKLELLGLHSCSMSSIEIAYQLQGLANYMIAQQGPSFVGSWPYRQLLKRIFTTVDQAKDGDIDIQKLAEKLYLLSLYNGTDFMMAGYSSEMALCNLQPGMTDDLTDSLQQLVKLLGDALARATDANVVSQNGGPDPIKALIVSLISRAHAESQSYWGESYTDLYDFCDCLSTACKNVSGALANLALQKIIDACEKVKKSLATNSSVERSERFKNLVVRSEYFGWRFQHSHGLSIYFPWAEPLEVENVMETRIMATPRQDKQSTGSTSKQSIMDRYQNYKFTQTFASGYAWCDFLRSYFDGTQRALRNGQPSAEVLGIVGLDGPAEFLSTTAAAGGSFLGDDHKTTAEFSDDHKTLPEQGIGGNFSSIKNFHTQPGRDGRKIRAFSISPGALKAFKDPLPADVVEAAESARAQGGG
jgi:hypothetical protein